jgi:hypothetical protein
MHTHAKQTEAIKSDHTTHLLFFVYTTRTFAVTSANLAHQGHSSTEHQSLALECSPPLVETMLRNQTDLPVRESRRSLYMAET